MSSDVQSISRPGSPSTFVLIPDDAQPKSPYEVALQRIKDLGALATTYSQDMGFPNQELSRRLTLADFSHLLGNPEKTYLTSWLDLKKPIETVSQALGGRDLFYDRIKIASQRALAQVSLLTLRMETGAIVFFTKSPVWCALADKGELMGLLLSQLKDAPQTALSVLRTRLEEMDLTEDERGTILSRRTKEAGFWSSADMPILKMHLLSVDEINKYSSDLPPEAFALIPNSKLAGIDFSELETEQIAACLGGGEDDEEAICARYACLTQEQREYAALHLESRFLKFFPDECFQEFILQDPNVVRQVYGKSAGRKESGRRMALVPKEHIERLVTQLHPDDLQYFPEERISDLPFERMHDRHITEIFRQTDSKVEIQRKFALIPKRALSSLVSKLPKSYLEEFPDEEIQDLDYPNIADIYPIVTLLLSGTEDKIKKRVSLFSKETLEHLLPRLNVIPSSMRNESFLRYVTEEQLRSIDVQLFSESDVAFLFPSRSPEGVQPSAFYSVTVDLTGKRHHVFRWSNPLAYRSYTEEEMGKILEERRSIFIKNASTFEGKFHLMRFYSETRAQVEAFRRPSA